MPVTVTTEQVEAKVVQAFESFGVEADLVQRQATWEQLDVDSLDLVELAQVMHDEFGVEITSQDMQTLYTVGDAIDMVVARAA